MSMHDKYMKCCLELAQKAFGNVAPNPMVGCVIVNGGRIIGEGFHNKYGSAHAEVNAINSVQNINLLKNATLYVNLEPCSYFGKTPPCADLIAKRGIKYIVIGTIDPNPLVMGQGMKKLVSSGCDVKVGVLENECRNLNRRFFTFHFKKRPYIILKWAETADGFMGISGDEIHISGSKANRLGHQWRSREQSILVGTNTALSDNPELTVRKISGKNPLRIVIDRDMKIPASYHLRDGSVPTLIFTSVKKQTRRNLEYINADFDKNILKQILNELYARQIQSLIVEGGAKLLNSFLKNNLWDEVRVLKSTKTLYQITGKRGRDGITAPKPLLQTTAYKKISKTDKLYIFRNS